MGNGKSGSGTWQSDPASKSQRFYLWVLTKEDYRQRKITKGEASKLIDSLKRGKAAVPTGQAFEAKVAEDAREIATLMARIAELQGRKPVAAKRQGKREVVLYIPGKANVTSTAVVV
jgi:hypothetical protein